MEQPPEDIVVLYQTLVRDGPLPARYEQEFATQAKVIAPVAAREERMMANFGNVEAAVWLHDREKGKYEEEEVVQQTAAQFQWAAGERPRRYRTLLGRSLYDGPTARRDAEEAERQRWLRVLADLARGQLFATQPGSVEVLGGGKRASILRSRVRAIRKFLSWLHVTHGIQSPQLVEHFTEYLRMRLSEPCNRGALKTPYRAQVTPERADGYTRPGPADSDTVVLCDRPRTPLSGAAREAEQAGPEDVRVDAVCLGERRDGSAGAPLRTRVRMLDASPDLGDAAPIGSSWH